MNPAALQWIVSGDTGISSCAIWAHMVGQAPDPTWGRWNHPVDPADLGRCLRLLAKVPEWKPRIAEMAQYGEGWAALVPEWDRLSALLAEEIGAEFAPGRGKTAPRTYRAMEVLLYPTEQTT